MKDISGQSSDIKHGTQPRCRVAYTLNNSQPVACTIIGDQPLFYMDFDAGTDDDFMSEIAELGLLEREINQLKNEIDSYNKFSAGVTGSLEKRVEEFLFDAGMMTKGEKQIDNAATLAELKATLAQSRLAAAYLEFAEKHNVEIAFSSQVEKAFYDRRAGKILLNPHLNIADMTLLTVCELRRHWQHRQGALIDALKFHPDNAILINRAQTADLSVSMIRTAWEIQLSGNRTIWERIETSTLADLGRAFAREAFLDFRTINNGRASAAVFETWFLSERCRHQDKALIQQMLADHQGYVFDIDQSLTAVTPALISALGNMPYGKNYLAEHASMIIADPVFTDVRDRSNANFLWFIKFERSFKETEQELQVSGDLTATGISPAAKQAKDHAHEPHTAEIITLANSNLGTGKRRPVKNDGKAAQVVYLRRWSGDA